MAVKHPRNHSRSESRSHPQPQISAAPTIIAKWGGEKIEKKNTKLWQTSSPRLGYSLLLKIPSFSLKLKRTLRPATVPLFNDSPFSAMFPCGWKLIHDRNQPPARTHSNHAFTADQYPGSNGRRIRSLEGTTTEPKPGPELNSVYWALKMNLKLAAVLLELPLPVVQRAHVARFEPAGDAMKMESVVAHPPGYGAVLERVEGWVGLAFDAQVHDRVSANGAVVYDNVPRPQRHGIPLLDHETLLRLLAINAARWHIVHVHHVFRLARSPQIRLIRFPIRVCLRLHSGWLLLWLARGLITQRNIRSGAMDPDPNPNGHPCSRRVDGRGIRSIGSGVVGHVELRPARLTSVVHHAIGQNLSTKM